MGAWRNRWRAVGRKVAASAKASCEAVMAAGNRLLGGERKTTHGDHSLVARRRGTRATGLSALLHLLAIGLSAISFSARGCLRETPAGVPGGKGDRLPSERPQVATPQVVRRPRSVRQSPVTVYEMLREQDLQTQADLARQFSDATGVPDGVGEGAAAAGSPKGTVLGGTLYFRRIRFDGPGWNDNAAGVRPLMDEVLKAGVVRKVSGANEAIGLGDLPRHKEQYFPALLYITGTGQITVSDEDASHLRDYLLGGGMVFADLSGGAFHQHFVAFMQRVMPEHALTPIEYDHEIYRGRTMPYAMTRGCPIYRRHEGAGPAMGLWVGNRLSVFYSRGDLAAGWQAAGLVRARRHDVEQAFRMGVNVVAYSLLYMKRTVS